MRTTQPRMWRLPEEGVVFLPLLPGRGPLASPSAPLLHPGRAPVPQLLPGLVWGVQDGHDMCSELGPRPPGTELHWILCFLSTDVPAWTWPLWESMGWCFHDCGRWTRGAARERPMWLPHPQRLWPRQDGCPQSPAGWPRRAGHHQDRPTPVPCPLPHPSATPSHSEKGKLSAQEALDQSGGRGGQWQRFVGSTIDGDVLVKVDFVTFSCN